jgi:pyruvate dehydrogenase E2 component (dihydrolipoamide acetyltransferase)
MAVEFRLPDLGEGLVEGEIVKWLVTVGDFVKEGEPFVQVETDKALVEIPSPTTGVVLALLAKEGDRVGVGEVIAIFGEPGEKPAHEVGQVEVAARGSVGVVGTLEEAPPDEEAKGEGEVLALPYVRRLAKDLGVDLGKIRGSGPGGRVTEEDVRRASPSAPKPRAVRKYDFYGYVERIPLKGMRRTIAEAMALSASKTAHVTATEEWDASRLFSLRESLREAAAKEGVHLTILAFLVKASALALKDHPFLNATLDEEAQEIVLKKYYNIGVAVDTAEGLMVPVVKGVLEKSLLQIAREIQELAKKARDRTIDLADLKGGTFTITNYGAIGGILGTPIIRYPEVAILGVGRAVERPIRSGGGISWVPMLPVSLSFDHRVVDGAEAARFLRTMGALICTPEMLLLQ